MTEEDIERLSEELRELEDRLGLEPSEEIDEIGRTVAFLQD